MDLIISILFTATAHIRGVQPDIDDDNYDGDDDRDNDNDSDDDDSDDDNEYDDDDDDDLDSGDLKSSTSFTAVTHIRCVQPDNDDVYIELQYKKKPYSTRSIRTSQKDLRIIKILMM
jgi:hypothetical protein